MQKTIKHNLTKRFILANLTKEKINSLHRNFNILLEFTARKKHETTSKIILDLSNYYCLGYEIIKKIVYNKKLNKVFLDTFATDKNEKKINLLGCFLEWFRHNAERFYGEKFEIMINVFLNEYNLLYSENKRLQTAKSE